MIDDIIDGIDKVARMKNLLNNGKGGTNKSDSK